MKSGREASQRQFFKRPMQTRMPRKLGFAMCAILFAAFAAVVAVTLTGRESGKAETRSAGRISATGLVMNPDGAGLGAYKFVVGERAIYDLSYSSASVADFTGLFAALGHSKEQAAPSDSPLPFRTVLRAELAAAVLSTDGNSAVVAYSLRNTALNLETNGQQLFTDAEQISSDLGREIFAVVNSKGKILSVGFGPGVGTRSQYIARTLLALTQFVFPGDEAQVRDLHHWESREDDPSGECLTLYQVESVSSRESQAEYKDAVGAFRKSKVRYLKSQAEDPAGEPSAFKVIEPGRGMLARFDFEEGRVLSLDGSESQRVTIAGKTVARAGATLHVNYLRKERLSHSELDQLLALSAERGRTGKAASLVATPSKEETDAAVQRAKLGSATLESLLAELAAAEAGASRGEDDTPLYLKFKALVYVHPESCASLARILASADVGSVTMRLLVGAIGAVGHEQAQAALVSVIRERARDWQALCRLIPALGDARLPAPFAEEELRELASGAADGRIASTAHLSLGVMARSLAGTSPERAAALVDWLVSHTEASPSAEATKQLLLALGNAGSTRALPVMERFAADASPDLRAAAVLSLRWVDSSKAETLLAEALSLDSSATVRLNAAVALGFRRISPATFEAQKRALLNDKDANVRVAVLKDFCQSRESLSAAQALLRRAASRDASKEVRHAASTILASLRDSRLGG